MTEESNINELINKLADARESINSLDEKRKGFEPPEPRDRAGFVPEPSTEDRIAADLTLGIRWQPNQGRWNASTGPLKQRRHPPAGSAAR